MTTARGRQLFETPDNLDKLLIDFHNAYVASLGLPDDKHSIEYRQPLVYDKLLVGVLRFRCKSGETIAQDRIDSAFDKIHTSVKAIEAEFKRRANYSRIQLRLLHQSA